MTLSTTSLVIILCVALGTYGLRVSGLLFSQALAKGGKVDLFLHYLPPTLLLSLIAPAILKEGTVGLFAALVIMLVMAKTKNILLSLVLGVAVIAVGRHYLV